ncbi:MAG: hypothetical protein ACTSRZ_00705 [Promethearchaeota archaeon]
MQNEDQIYERGLFFLQKNPPNFTKALSLIRKAKDLYEIKGKMREYKAALDKLNFIYSNLSERYFLKSKDHYKLGKYKEAIKDIQKAKKYYVLSNPKNVEKGIKKYQNILDNIIVDFLLIIEKQIRNEGFSENFLSEFYFILKVLCDEYFPNLISDDGKISSSFFREIGVKRKLQKAVLNTIEIIALFAKNKAKEYIKEKNITLALKMLKIAEQLYKQANFNQELMELKTLFNKIYEAHGDAEFNEAKKLVESGRLNKAREHFKKAWKFYKKIGNTKKKEISEKSYLDVSLKLGEIILNTAYKAEEFGDLQTAVQKLIEADKFFKKINHKKSIQKIKRDLKRIYKKLGDLEYKKYENLDFEEFKRTFKEFSFLELKISKDIALEIEYELHKLHILRDILFYYGKSNNVALVNRIEKKIEQHTTNIAEKFYTEARKHLKLKNYEQAYLIFKKAIFYYESIKKERKASYIRGEIEKLYKKLNLEKLKQIEEELLIPIHEQVEVEENESPTTFRQQNIVKESIIKDQYHCNKCGKWVPAYFYDSIQERCLDCRETIRCDECGKDIAANEIYMECQKCGAMFDLDCADLVFDFVQKRCSKCREEQICDVCGTKSKINQTFYTCANCGKDFCPSHFDIKNNLCFRCKNLIKCNICGKNLELNEQNLCPICGKYFCSQHFDFGRNVCFNDRKEEICANCGNIISKEQPAFKCKICGFLYCNEHFLKEYDICSNCYHEQPNIIEELSYHQDLQQVPPQLSQSNAIQQEGATSGISNNTTINISQAEKSEDIKESSSIPSMEEVTDSDQLFIKLRRIVDKYNQKHILDSEEIHFLQQHSINLPKDESSYINIGESEEYMVILNDENGIPYVILTPRNPIIEDSTYLGDLMRKLNKYLPDVKETIDGMTTIMNLLFYSVHNPNWDKIYYFLRQTLLKPGIEVLNLLRLIFISAPYLEIKDSILQSPFKYEFINENIEDILNFIKNLESEDSIELFSEKDKLDQLLRAFYRLMKGNILGAAELLSIYEI